MKIFFGSHYGKDISELESGYLIWIIEKYEAADWLLINECKKELSARLKLDWKEPEPHEYELMREIDKLKKANTELLEGKIFFEKICWLFGIEEIDYMKYARSHQWLDEDIEFSIDENWRKIPYTWNKHPIWIKFKEEELKKDLDKIEQMKAVKTIKSPNSIKQTP